MGSIKAVQFSSDVPAYVELPVGTHIIGDKKYTVVEKVRDEGLEYEYKYNVIDLIEPVTPGADENI